MKYKKILIATILLLAILSVGAVSASQDADVIAQDLDEVVSEDIAVGNDLGAVVDEDNLTQPSRYEYLNNSTIDEEPADGPTTILEVYGTEYMPIGYDNDLVFSIIVSGDEKSGKWKPVDELSDARLYVESDDGEIEFLNVKLTDLDYTAVGYMNNIEHQFTLSDVDNFIGLVNGDVVKFFILRPPVQDAYEARIISFGEDFILLDEESDNPEGYEANFWVINDIVIGEQEGPVAYLSLQNGNGGSVSVFHVNGEDDPEIFSFNFDGTEEINGVNITEDEMEPELMRCYNIFFTDLDNLTSFESGDEIHFIYFDDNGEEITREMRRFSIDEDVISLENIENNYPYFDVMSGMALNDEDPVAVLYVPSDGDTPLYTGWLVIESDNEGQLYSVEINGVDDEIEIYLSDLNNFENVEDGDSIYFDFNDDEGNRLAHETRRLCRDEDQLFLEDIGEDDDEDIYFNVNHRVYLYKDDDLFATLIYHLDMFDNLTGGRILVIGADNVMFDKNVSFAEDSWGYDINVSDLKHVENLQDDDILRFVFWSNEGEVLTSAICQCHYESGTLVNDQCNEIECNDVGYTYFDHEGNYVECNDTLLKFYNYQYYNQTEVIVRIEGREIPLDVNELPIDEEENVPYCTYSDVGLNEPGFYEFEIEVTYNLGFTYIFSDIGVELHSIMNFFGYNAEYIGDIIAGIREIDGVSGGNVVATLTDSEGQSFVLFNRSHNDFAYANQFFRGWQMCGNYIVMNDFQINETATYTVNLKYYDEEGYLLSEDEKNITFDVGENQAKITDEFSIGILPIAYLDFTYPVAVGSKLVILMDGAEVYNRVLPLALEFLSFDLYDYPEFITKTGTHNVTIKFVNEDTGYEEIITSGQTKYLSDSGNVEIDMPSEIDENENLTFTVSANDPEDLRGDYRLAVFIDPETMPTFWEYGDVADLYLEEDGLEEYVWSGDKLSINLGSLEKGTHQIYVAYCLCDEWWDSDNLPDFYYGYFNVTVGANTPAIATTLTASDVSADYNSGKYLLTVLKDADGNPVKGAKINIEIGNVTYNVTTNAAGSARLYMDSSVEPISTTAKVSFAGDATYAASNTTSKVVINKIATNLAASTFTTTYQSGGYFLVILKDADGNPVGGARVSFALNGVMYKIATDGNGRARLNIDMLPVGTYTTKVAFYGNSIYEKSNQAAARIIVKKIDTTLAASSFTTVYKSGSYFLVILKDADGNPVGGARVSFALNGVMYKIATDGNGRARLNIDMLPVGTYTTKVAFYGNDIYEKSNQASARIIVKSKTATKLAASSFTTTYQSGSYFLVILKDVNGNPVKGASVAFALNGVMYKILTDGNGRARLNIDMLPVGTYTTKVAFYGNNLYDKTGPVSARIVVKAK